MTIPEPPSLSVVVGLDPGLRACGLGILCEKVLIEGILVENTIGERLRGEEAHITMALAVWMAVAQYDVVTLAIEKPQHYKGVSFRGQATKEDLDEVKGVVKAIIKLFKKMRKGIVIVEYLPREWKGTVAKPVMLQRIEGRLSLQEVATIKPIPKGRKHGKNRDDILDGIGIALHHVGRRLIG